MAAATGGRDRRRRRSQYLSKVSSPAHLTLPRGAAVEVRLDYEGFHGSWYEATVVDFAPADGRRVRYYTATYSHLVEDDGCSALTEVFPASHVRPRPPPPSESSSPPPFHLYDIVEAFHYDGWWTGIVMPTRDSTDPGASASATATVTVGFPITRESVEFPPHLVRPRRDYVDGHWVPSRAAMPAPRYKLRTYETGEKVEVGRHRDLYGYSWFPATVARVIDDLSYVVDYGEGKATEYVHWRFIRPASEHFRRDSESESQLVPGNQVEAYCKGAWSLGEVDRVIRGKWKYKVIVGNDEEYLLVTKMVELLKPTNNWNNWIGDLRSVTAQKPSANLRRVSMSGESPRALVDVTCNGDEQHSDDPESPATKKPRKDLKQLDGILAEGSEHSPHCSLVMGTPLSDQNRNDPVCTDHSAAQVVKSNHVMETAIPSPDYRVEQTGGKVDQLAVGKVDESSVFLRRLQNAGSSKSTMDSSALKSCSASEIMLPSPPFLSSLRPADEHLLKPPNNSSGNRRRIVVAKRLVNFRTPSMSCENPSSPVDVTSNGDEYSHDPGSLAVKESRKDLKQLDGTLAEGLEHSSMVMGTPFSDQNRNDHVCTDHSTTQVVKSNLVMETTISSIDYRVQQASGRLGQQASGRLDQQASGEVDESSVFLSRLQNAESSQSTIDSSQLRSCSASESLLPSPLASKPLFVKSSPIWPQIEAMDVFSVYPQQPHFLPLRELREFTPTMLEGVALGLMAVFPDLVSVIRKASIDNSMEWFEDKFRTLRYLEGHGFSAQSLHSTLTELVKIKSQYTTYLGEMVKLDKEVEMEAASLTRMGALLDEKDSAIAELEQKLGCLRQETQKIVEEMETKDTKLSILKSKQSKFKEAYGDAKLEFHSVLAALPGSS